MLVNNSTRQYSLWSSVFALGFSVLSSHAAQLNGKEIPIHHVPSETCKECHSDIYAQWKGSMHANSTAMKDSAKERVCFTASVQLRLFFMCFILLMFNYI